MKHDIKQTDSSSVIFFVSYKWAVTSHIGGPRRVFAADTLHQIQAPRPKTMGFSHCFKFDVNCALKYETRWRNLRQGFRLLSPPPWKHFLIRFNLLWSLRSVALPISSRDNPTLSPSRRDISPPILKVIDPGGDSAQGRENGLRVIGGGGLDKFPFPSHYDSRSYDRPILNEPRM